MGTLDLEDHVRTELATRMSRRWSRGLAVLSSSGAVVQGNYNCNNNNNSNSSSCKIDTRGTPSASSVQVAQVVHV